jgi:hypothetical protein
MHLLAQQYAIQTELQIQNLNFVIRINPAWNTSLISKPTLIRNLLLVVNSQTNAK